MFKKQDYKDAASATAFLGLNLVTWVVILIVISIGVTAVWLGVERWRQNRLTEIMRQTNQYVTTQQTMMLTWADEYRENEIKAAETSNAEVKTALRSQNMALCEQMRQSSVRIDAQYIPADVSIILQGGCK